MKTCGVTVNCSLCGKKLRGHEGITGIHVSRHKAPDGKRCWGDHRTDHRMVPQSAPTAAPADAVEGEHFDGYPATD